MSDCIVCGEQACAGHDGFVMRKFLHMGNPFSEMDEGVEDDLENCGFCSSCMKSDETCGCKGGKYLKAEGYSALADVLSRAFDQSARGKGKERHSKGEEFTQQVIIEGARRFGTGALLFQAFKKSEESQRLPKEMAVKELLGAIVYLAGAVIVLEETP